MQSRLPLLSLLALTTITASCAQAQDEPDDAPEDTPQKAAPKKATPPRKVAKRATSQTLHVIAGAPKGGNGSQQKPFSSIQEAIDAALGGDTILVGAGTYEGGITLNTAYPDDAPLSIRAAEGTQPVISGMKPVSGWKAGPNGIYTTEIESRADNLFSGAERLPMGSWPKVDAGWIKVASIDAPGNKLIYTGQAPPQLSKNAKLYTFSSALATYKFRSLQGVTMEGEQGSIALDEKTAASIKTDKVNRFTFFNSPSFITEGDEWAVDYPDATRTRFSFKPSSPDQLTRTQYRAGGTGISVGKGSANVLISGFVVTGMNGTGISVREAQKVTIENCVTYNNEGGFSAREISDLTLRRCISMQNYWGMNFSDGKGILVEECEVAFNDEDGIRISGRVWDKASNKLGASDIQFKSCYVHHHQYQGHPDNIQFFRGVGRTQFDKCLLLFGGQQLMMEQTADMGLSNSVVLASINRSLNLFSYKTPDGKGWKLANNTIGYSRYNPVYVGGQNNSSSANLFFQYQQPVTFAPQGLEANYDWFAPRNGISLDVDKTAKFVNATDFGAKSTLETNAKMGDPKLRNVPASMTVAFGSGGSSAQRLNFDGDAAATFSVGDLIEINGDGVVRKVQSLEKSAITFLPALPASPFRYSNVFNWKNNSNFQLDTRPQPTSPLLTAGANGTSVGSSLDIAAYQKGDFNSDGQRDLPPLPKELADMLGHRPNRYIYPYSL